MNLRGVLLHHGGIVLGDVLDVANGIVDLVDPLYCVVNMRPPMIASTVPTIIADRDIVVERWLISLPLSCVVLTNCSSV